MRRPSAALDIVVFDTTQTALVPGLTYWWRAGALVARAAGCADVVVRAGTWRSALTQIRDVVKERSTPGHQARIGLLQIWGHGRDGAMLIGGDALDSAALAPDSGLRLLLEDVRDALDPESGSVWFRGCNTFRGEVGRLLARTAAAFFGVPVAGHTFVIWAFHSGTHVLVPGESPNWPADEGVRRRARTFGLSAASDTLWSSPFRASTIAALRFSRPQPVARSPQPVA